jgi:hypothetical protein
MRLRRSFLRCENVAPKRGSLCAISNDHTRRASKAARAAINLNSKGDQVARSDLILTVCLARLGKIAAATAVASRTASGVWPGAAWCETQQPVVYYCLGLARNSRLVELIEQKFARVRESAILCGGVARGAALGPLHHLRSTHRIAEKLQELIAQKDKRIRELEADKQQQAQEIKLLKEKVDLLIRRLFGSKSEKLDSAQLELLLRDLDLGKADASAEKAEVAPNVEVLKPVAKRPNNNQRRERWPKELAVEQEVIEPEEVRNNPEAFRCIGEEITEMLDYRPAKFFRRQIIRRKFVRKQETELPPIIAPLPESLQQRCIAAPGLLAGIITLFAEPLDYAARHAHIGKKPYY